MSVLRLSLLGQPEAWLDEAPLTAFSTAKTEALLYYLAVTGHPHSREALARLFWGDMPDDKAKRNLTKALSTLRGLVGPYLLMERQSVEFNRAATHSLDVAAFEAAAARGNSREAAALYRGDFLEGFNVKDAQDFDEWALVTRERLREQALHVLDELVARDSDAGDYATSTEHARRLLALDPWRESAHRQLMTLLARRGQHSAALAQYEKCRQLLADELGVAPMAETTALYERIQVARMTPLRPLPADVEPFVGRTAELAQIARMLADASCRLVTIVGAGGMGKTRLALAAARAINRDGARPFINGVVFVPLEVVERPADMPLALASALDIPLAGQAKPEAAVADWLRNKEMLLVLDNLEHLVEGAGWLTPLLSGAPHVKLLVTSREPLHLAAEWRLNLEGLAYPEPGTTPEETADTYEAVALFSQAARQAAGPGYAITPAEVPHVYRLCQLAAGMPLALKLAAAWVRVLPVEQIVAEVERSLDVLATPMRDVPPRQRSVRAIFNGAVECLAAGEPQALAALSVFQGGFRLEAAQAVAAAGLPTLAALVDRSLLQATPEGRYHMHPLLRQLAAERLAQAGEAEGALRQQHSAFYLGWLKGQEAALTGADQLAAVTAIGADFDNVQTAWRWAVSQHAADSVAVVIGPLYAYLQARSRYQNGEELFGWAAREWEQAERVRATPDGQPVLAQLLARWGVFASALQDYAGATEHLNRALALTTDKGERTLALMQLGNIAVDQGERTTGEGLLRDSLEISRTLGDLNGQAEALMALGKAGFEAGEFVPAQALAAEALALFRQLGRPDRIASALGTLAWPTNCLGGYAESEAYWRESQALQRELGDTLGVAINTSFIGWGAWCVGGTRLPEALAQHEAALAIYREVGNRYWLAMVHADMALTSTEMGEGKRAVRLAREGLAYAESAGTLHMLSYCRVVLGAALCEAGDLAGSRAVLNHALQASLDLDKRDTVMNALYFLARLLLKEGAVEGKARALRLLALVAQQPATWQPIRDRAEALLEAVKPGWREAGVAAVGWEGVREWASHGALAGEAGGG